MTMTAKTVTSSYNLKREWQSCCEKARGYDYVEYGEEEKKEDGGGIVILNLLEFDDDEEDDDLVVGGGAAAEQPSQPSDTWMENAIRIYESLTKIIDILERKKHSYLQPHQEDDASLLESTILSFVATTANQIESLRQAISSSNLDYANHCSGIVSYLLASLKEEIANPFAKLQKQRARPARSLWDTPLQCRLPMPKNNSTGTSSNGHPFDDDEDELERELRFIPSMPLPNAAGMNDFMDTYQEMGSFSKEDLQRPKSIFERKRISDPTVVSKDKTSKNHKQTPEPLPLPHQQEPDSYPTNNDDETFESILQHEALLLTATLQNDLDSVQQVEARMTEITALLGQFSNLVSEQQTEITTIHDVTLKSQQNVNAGQDHLVDAAERTKQSRHLMATVVFAMAILLLFLNSITP